MISNIFFIKNLCKWLLAFFLLFTSGCLLKKEIIPEYLPKSSEKQEVQIVKKESGYLEEALSEIEATTRERITLSSNGTM